MSPEPPGSPSPEAQPPQQHRSAAPQVIRCAVITVSDTRTAADDRGGQAILDLLKPAGHVVAAREIIPDEPLVIGETIRSLIARAEVDALLLTGGTGIAPRDHTTDVVEGLLDKALPGYGELLRMLSYQQVGAAAMLSRATGGVIGGKVVLTMPGSPNAVRLAMEKLILPELGHLVSQATT